MGGFKMRLKVNKGTTGKNIITLILVAVVFGGVWLMINSSKVSVEANTFKASGIYGINVSLDNIEEVTLQETLPRNFYRVNGIDWFGGVHIGNFKAENMPKIKAFVKSEKSLFIYIKTKDDLYMVFNEKDKKQTESLYEEISSKIKK
jgi:hypothetical protein